MRRYKSTYDFIHICYESRKERLITLAKRIGIETTNLDPHKQNIHSIMDFIKRMDERCHKYEGDPAWSALGQTFHLSISSDLRTMIILVITQQNFQLNIILRHFIEVFIVSLWIDIASQFTGGFYHLLESDEWKPHRNRLKVTWKYDKKNASISMENRLQRIRDLNNIRGQNFLKRYFLAAKEADFRLLISLPICDNCKKGFRDKVNYRRYRLSSRTRKKQKEDELASYKTDFSKTCNFCNRNVQTKGYLLGIPNANDMIEMLKAITNSKFRESIETLDQVYDYLSREFVHFATGALPDKQPNPKEFGKGKNKVSLWGLEGVSFCLSVLNPLTNYYFTRLRFEK